MNPVRLHKYVSDSSSLSRRAVERAWRAGRIAVALPGQGARLDCPLDELIFEGDVVMLDGAPLELLEPSVYMAFHKPEGILTTSSDPQGRPCLAPWLEQLSGGAAAVGRLDRETSGLLLLTDDGDLGFVLMRPDFHVTKEYHLRVKGRLSEDDPRLQCLLDGVEIGDGLATALTLRLTGWSTHTTTLRMTIDEGRHRQIRRMCRGVHLPLVHLHRTRIGPLSLGNVEPGELRALTKFEIEELWRVGGTRETAAARAFAALVRRAERAREAGTPHERLDDWLVRREDQRPRSQL
ncbi:MAG: rRNA pseudouridine synthase [Bradymonadaceae bacterium]|nr:rRNA pseudouridine synthase [Lujinxingiaceae bacterium]